jgi:hypothetical protein
MVNGEDFRNSWLEHGRNANVGIAQFDVGTWDAISTHSFEGARKPGTSPFHDDTLGELGRVLDPNPAGICSQL